ncbi:TetR/AcrR family transcriptional regulator [Paenibacillus radicis (ex Gao et al. 2016)]|uniref:TetR family transcriptional regulator n=1 Tax=Paenibacillus radicis (ex Gao et al. 2016) TaxID=1737354 RepID=A0A917H5J6_9BACL|nr:TetR/AcrR family transcriptional regulator [Paenibacillus radicis (ex Gao et al. 2016)]GGG67986.1 TetR family transcriptional regulator [Paenibacillus radicis (ex Gao et al. 2016)]
MARSKQFDESEVLHKAMQLFWEQGYEKTSMNDLVEHMGIHRRSLYDTFGDKRTLFLKALERYSDIMEARLSSGVARSESAMQAIRFLFDFMIEGYDDKPSGCLFVNTAVELGPRDAEIGEKAVQGFTDTEQLLTDIIGKGQQSGEFKTKLDASELAEHLHNTLLGLRVQGRASVDKEKLHRIARLSLTSLNQ